MHNLADALDLGAASVLNKLFENRASSFYDVNTGLESVLYPLNKLKSLRSVYKVFSPDTSLLRMGVHVSKYLLVKQWKARCKR